MKRILSILSVGVFVWTASILSADTLKLQSGETIDGTFLGGDARQVRFIGSDGVAKSYAVSDVASINFQTTASESAAPAAPAASSSASAAGSANPSATIPAGTVVSVRMIDSIDADVTAAGERFRASIDDPVSIDGQVVIPRGADATVQITRVEQAGKVAGSDEIALKLYDITVNGTAYQLATNYAEVKGEGKGKETAKTTAVTTGVGAVIGGILGGGKGAAIGAGAGAGTGVAVSAARGKTLRIPSESRLDFVLRAPLGLD